MATQHWLEFYKIQKESLEYQVKKLSRRIEELEGKLTENNHTPSDQPKKKKKKTKTDTAEPDGAEPEKKKAKSTAEGGGGEEPADDATHKLGRWSKEEIQKLQEAMQKYGQGDLDAITQHIGTRSAKSVKSKMEQPEHDDDNPKKKKSKKSVKPEENHAAEEEEKEKKRKQQEEEEKEKKRLEEEETERKRIEEEETERRRLEEEEDLKRFEEEAQAQAQRKKREEEEEKTKKKKKKSEDDEEKKSRKKARHASETPIKTNINPDADEEISFKYQVSTPMIDALANAHTPISEESKKSTKKPKSKQSDFRSPNGSSSSTTPKKKLKREHPAE